MRLYQQLLTVARLGLLAFVACRPTVASEPSVVPSEPARVEPAFDPASTIWTADRAADPELLHLHIMAATAPGAFVVPWLEGVTFRPCAVQVEAGDDTLQSARFEYDGEGRLAGLTVDGRSQPIERDEDGRLVRGHGFRYEWSAGRVARVVEPGARAHELQYDAEGRLTGVESTHEDESPLRRHVLDYDEDDRLAVRRFSGAAGGAGVTYFVYDEEGRLVRIDVEFTDSQGTQSHLPAVRLEYDGDRLVEFGPSTIAYDEAGHVTSLTDDRTVTRYDYDCAP